MERRISERPSAARLRNGAIGTLLAAGIGLLLWLLPHREGTGREPADNWLARFSFDLPWQLRAAADLPLDDFHIITMGEDAYRGTGTPYGSMLARDMLARLVDQLHRDGCKLIVFDVWLADPGLPETDRALEEAIRRHGRVVLAAELERLPEPLPGVRVILPHKQFAEAVGTNWGISHVLPSGDLAIRRYFPGLSNPSLPWAAASLAGAAVTTNDAARLDDRWIRYYGRSVELASMGYQHTTNQLPNFFRDKIVFIGGRPKTLPVGEKADVFPTPLTAITGEPRPGVEIQATIFLNLLRGDWLRRLPWTAEFMVLLGAAALFGFILCRVTPQRGAAIAIGGIVVVSLAGLVLPLRTSWWFSWMVVAAGQIPCAWAWSVFAALQRLMRESTARERKARLMEELDGLPQPVAPPDATIPTVPDHVLLRRIGQGAFGEVWLGRNPVGLLHAVKMVFRREFRDAAPYEREFNGIRKFMPISLEHPGWVRVLHVGRDDAAGFFHYVMELGDDLNARQEVEPSTYEARTLETDCRQRTRLPLGECVDLGLRLTEALEFLHAQHLVHRDIKPSNVIFVGGRPKFADIGLVTEMREVDETRTFTGSRGYIPQEGAGTAVADVFSLGRVLYVLATGMAADAFPELPPDIGEQSDVPGLFLFNDILLKACDPDPGRRYQSAAELRAALQRWKERAGH